MAKPHKRLYFSEDFYKVIINATLDLKIGSKYIPHVHLPSLDGLWQWL